MKKLFIIGCAMTVTLLTFAQTSSTVVQEEQVEIEELTLSNLVNIERYKTISQNVNNLVDDVNSQSKQIILTNMKGIRNNLFINIENNISKVINISRRGLDNNISNYLKDTNINNILSNLIDDKLPDKSKVTLVKK